MTTFNYVYFLKSCLLLKIAAGVEELTILPQMGLSAYLWLWALYIGEKLTENIVALKNIVQNERCFLWPLYFQKMSTASRLNLFSNVEELNPAISYCKSLPFVSGPWSMLGKEFRLCEFESALDQVFWMRI